MLFVHPCDCTFDLIIDKIYVYDLGIGLRSLRFFDAKIVARNFPCSKSFRPLLNETVTLWASASCAPGKPDKIVAVSNNIITQVLKRTRWIGRFGSVEFLEIGDFTVLFYHVGILRLEQWAIITDAGGIKD